VINLTTFHGRTPELEKFTNTYLDKTYFTEFIDQFDLHCLGLGIPRQNLARLLPMYFSDGALLVYKKVIDKAAELADDYPKLVFALKAKFGKKSGVPANELANITKRPDQTTCSFYNKVKTLAQQVYPNISREALDAIIKTHFIGGLDEATQIYFMDREDPVTAHDAYLMAERRENS
jgi:hypothetical protein